MLRNLAINLKFKLNLFKISRFSSIINEKVQTEQEVTPWTVKGNIDYNKLINQFGTEIITQELIEKFERITGEKVHPWIKRGIFFTHRGLNSILDAHEKGHSIFLYTGRGPSSESMHLGHLIPFIFTKWLQDTFKCILVIQISDEEKYAFKKQKFDNIYKLGFENAKEIIACGFESKNTFIFSNRDYRLQTRSFELLAHEMKNLSNLNLVKKIFGFNDDASISMIDWPFYQTAAAYSLSYPNIFHDKPAHCLIPHAIDQDPYFRLARDLSGRLKLPKPCNIMSTFVPPLTGSQGKMSSSENKEATIFLSDSEKVIRNKIMKYSFSGGGGDGTLEDHRKYGGNPEKDVAFQYLRYFEYDDNILDNVKKSFIKGELTCGELKKILLDKLLPIIIDIQNKKNKIDDKILSEFYDDKNKILTSKIIAQKTKIT